MRFCRRATEYYFLQKTTVTAKYSIIAPIYRVEKYLDRFLNSIANQSIGFHDHIQLILVDDGSDDGSSAICQTWAERHSDNILYLRKDNGGVVSAVNFGLPHAVGKWLTMFGPDDFIDQDYFLQVESALAEHQEDPPCLINCNTVQYFENEKMFFNDYPLAYRFRQGTRLIDIDNQAQPEFHLSAATSLFQLDKVRTLYPFTDIKPHFEDANLIARYLLAQEKRSILVVPGAKYYYRKRADKTSLLDTAQQDPRRYSVLPERGYLQLLIDAKKSEGKIPRWIQRLIIYDLSWQMQLFIDNDHFLAWFPKQQRQSYHELLTRIFAYIDTTELLAYEISGGDALFKMGIVELYKKDTALSPHVELANIDRHRKLICIRVLYAGTSRPTLAANLSGEPLKVTYRKTRLHNFMQHVFAREEICWCPWPGPGTLTVTVNGLRKPVKMPGKNSPMNEITIPSPQQFRPLPKQQNILPEHKDVLELAKQQKFARLFHRAWLLMDRQNEADDNAEHLYQYLMDSNIPINAWYVLDQKSSDWPRLAAKGFRLIAFDSLDHAVALLYAEHVISSHANTKIPSLFLSTNFRERPPFSFTFLGHGVMTNDISTYLNSTPIDRIICATHDEADFISNDHNNFDYCKREVVTTGLPRHDRLLELGSKKPEHILVMPTWRKSFWQDPSHQEPSQLQHEQFQKSAYFQTWERLLSDPLLTACAEKHGYKIVFFPHPEMKKYACHFSTSGIKIVDHRTRSLQDILARALLLVTDYSSVAFDMAYIGRPTIYYTYDEDDFYEGNHMLSKGYFDIRTHGFGPACKDHHSVVSATTHLIEQAGKPEPCHQERMERFFPFRDQKCSERVFQAILESQGRQ